MNIPAFAVYVYREKWLKLILQSENNRCRSFEVVMCILLFLSYCNDKSVIAVVLPGVSATERLILDVILNKFISILRFRSSATLNM